MLRVTIDVNAPEFLAQGVKEHLAMALEPFGDARVVAVEVRGPRYVQLTVTNGTEERRTL